MQVVILAGGLGTRLRPLTYKIPKAMVPIKGKPFLEHQLKILKNNGLNDILICIGYLGEEVKKYFGDGEKWGLNIEYSFEREPLDTGGAIKNAEDHLENEFLVLYGDTFLNINYKDLISYSRKKAKLGTIVVFKNKPKIFKNNIEVNDKKEVIAYNKREEDKANCVDAGVEIFKKTVLELIPPNKVISLEKDIYPILIEKRELIAYLTDHRFYDIGTFEQLKKINQIL
jgi:NDP-sugar pyrophosphorylase family protein